MQESNLEELITSWQGDFKWPQFDEKLSKFNKYDRGKCGTA